MKKRLAAILMAGVVIFNVTPAFAAELPSQAGGTLGDCLGAMTPDCPKNMGADFAAHIAYMVRGGDCSDLMQ